MCCLDTYELWGSWIQSAFFRPLWKLNVPWSFWSTWREWFLLGCSWDQHLNLLRLWPHFKILANDNPNLEYHFWKSILLMVSRNFTLDSSWTISAIGLTVSSTSSSEGFWNEVPSSLPWWEVFSNYFNLWSRKLWSTLRMVNSCLRVLTSNLVSLISFWKLLTIISFFDLVNLM